MNVHSNIGMPLLFVYTYDANRVMFILLCVDMYIYFQKTYNTLKCIHVQIDIFTKPNTGTSFTAKVALKIHDKFTCMKRF